MKMTWPAGDSAGSGVSAGECCRVWRDTGSFSERSKQLEKVWTTQGNRFILLISNFKKAVKVWMLSASGCRDGFCLTNES